MPASRDDYDTTETPACIQCGYDGVLDADDASEMLRERGEYGTWDAVTLDGDRGARARLLRKPEWTADAIDPMMNRDYYCPVCFTTFREKQSRQS